SVRHAARRQVTLNGDDFLACQERAQCRVSMPSKKLSQILSAFTPIHVCAQKALNGVGRLLRATAVSNGTAKAGKGAHTAAQAEVIGVLKMTIYFDLFAFQSDIRNAMLPATVWASGNVQFELLIKSGQTVFQFFHQPSGKCFCLSDGQLAKLGSGAGHGAAPESRCAHFKLDCFEFCQDFMNVFTGYVDDHQVLRAGGAKLAGAE